MEHKGFLNSTSQIAASVWDWSTKGFDKRLEDAINHKRIRLQYPDTGMRTTAIEQGLQQTIENKVKDEARRNKRLICFLKHANENNLRINPVILESLKKEITLSEESNRELLNLININTSAIQKAVVENTVSLPFDQLMLLIHEQRFENTFPTPEARQAAIKHGLTRGTQNFSTQVTNLSQNLQRILEIGKGYGLDIQTLATLLSAIKTTQEQLTSMEKSIRPHINVLADNLKSLTEAPQQPLQENNPSPSKHNATAPIGSPSQTPFTPADEDSEFGPFQSPSTNHLHAPADQPLQHVKKHPLNSNLSTLHDKQP